MALRIILKEVNDPFVNSPSYTGKQSNCFKSLSTSNQETIMDYNHKDDSALSLKQAVAKHISQQSYSIELLYQDNDINSSCYIELNDSDNITKLQAQPQSCNILNNSTILRTIDDDIVLYYKLIAYSIQVKIDVYQKNINKISETVSLSCSILNLKHSLMQRFSIHDNMDVNNQKIFSLSLKNRTKKVKIKMLANKEYNDRQKLIDIIKEYEEQKRMRFSYNDNIALKFLLVLNTREAIKMGLNFDFNYFKNLSQISFENSAPVHRECSDGLNLFSYCRNTQCPFYNELFVRNLGYGGFNIINEIIRTRCPKCLCASLVEARNLGMINAKWEYRGALNRKKESGFEGDGVTIISNKLYLFSEVKINSAFCKLMIKIKPFKANNDPDAFEENNEASLFDSIPLCFDEKNYEGRLNESNMSKVDMVISPSVSVSQRQVKDQMKGEINLQNVQNQDKNAINILSSQGYNDDYCLQRCLLNKRENSSCYII